MIKNILQYVASANHRYEIPRNKSPVGPPPTKSHSCENTPTNPLSPPPT